MKKETVRTILQSKGKRKLTMITAYDALFAKLLEPHCDMILVGDSLNMSFAGKEDTLSATLDQMIYHTNAVCAGAPNSFVVTTKKVP
jgi:3-methyl-2-oxobutanoate hydroxymethyltransferase